MDNNKEPQENSQNNNIPTPPAPNDSEKDISSDISTPDTIKTDNDISSSETSESSPITPEAHEAPIGFEHYSQHSNNTGLVEIKKKKFWFFEKDADVPKNYNPYREDRSVFKEIFEENPDAFAGNTPLPDETIENYNIRIHREWLFARSKAASKLKKSSTLVSLVIILFLALSNCFALAFIPFSWLEDVPYAILNRVLMVIQYAFMFPAVIYIINLGKKHKTLTFFQKCEVSKLYIFKWSIISIGISYLVNLVFRIIFSIIESMGVHINDLATTIPSDPIELIIYFFAVSICAPIFEEILFRGSILAQNLKHGAFFASVISGILFGLVHQNHEQMFFAAVIGFIFCFIDIKAGSVIPSIVAHMSINLYSCINMFFLSFTNYNDIINDPTAALEGPTFALFVSGIISSLVYVLIVIAVVLISHELLTNRNHFFLSKGDNILTGGEKAKIFFSSPATIIMLIFLTISIAVNSFIDMDALANILQG